MSEDTKPSPPPFPSVAFVGYKGGELVWNIVETRTSKDTENVLLDNKKWPNIRKIATPADGFEMPVTIEEGAHYAGKNLRKALEGLDAYYEKKVKRYANQQTRVKELLDAEERKDTDAFKDYRAQ
jgi:hypothetical protein